MSKLILGAPDGRGFAPRVALAALAMSWGLGLAASCDRSPPTLGDSAVASERDVVRVTGVPDENPTDLIRRNQPLVAHLSERLDAEIDYVPVTDYGAAVEALRSGKVDFAWLGGFTFVQAKRLAGAVPLVMREIDRSFQTVFVAGVHSGIAGPEDLRGKAFAFGSKSSTSGHLMPRHFLESSYGIDPDADFDGPPLYTGAHDATAKAVESGKVAAGALNKLVWRRMLEQGKVDPARVRAVWETPPYVDYVWAARPSVSPERREAFRDAFLALELAIPGDAAVLAVQDAKRFVPARLGDFDAIEGIGLATGLLAD